MDLGPGSNAPCRGSREALREGNDDSIRFVGTSRFDGEVIITEYERKLLMWLTWMTLGWQDLGEWGPGCKVWRVGLRAYALWSSRMASELRDRDQTTPKKQLAFQLKSSIQEFRLHPRQRLVLVRPKPKKSRKVEDMERSPADRCTGTANSLTWPASHLCLLWQSVPLRFQSGSRTSLAFRIFQMCFLEITRFILQTLIGTWSCWSFCAGGKGSNMWTAASVTLPSTVAAGMTARSFEIRMFLPFSVW